MTKKATAEVLLRPFELADIYALKTLTDYISTNAQGFQCFIDQDDMMYCWRTQLEEFQTKKVRSLVSTYPFHPLPKNALRVYSDISRYSEHPKTLEIDISILKNCVEPQTPEQKAALRRKYGIPEDRPVLTISYSFQSKSEFSIVSNVCDLATIIFVSRLDIDTTQSAERIYSNRGLDTSHMRFISQKGVLKDYYALADVALNAENLYTNNNFIHNFVEAVQGGPLFHIRPGKTNQFGYKDLVKRKAIVECQSAGLVADQVAHYMRNFNGGRAHMQAVSAHLEKCRGEYLPMIVRYMKHVFCNRPAPNESLRVERKSFLHHEVVRITHPETNWETEIKVC